MDSDSKKIFPINLLIVEDNKFIRSGWELVLGNSKDFKITGSFSNCEDALNSTVIPESDMILLDIGLPGMSGVDGIRHFKRINNDLIIVMCTVHEESTQIYNAICAGAVGYLLKKINPDELKRSLIDAYNGGSPMTPSVARKVIESFQSNVKSSDSQIVLTDRENEILQLMAKGKSYAAIADEVYLSVDGVYYHIRHIYEKLQVHSRAEAISVGLKKKLIPPFYQ
ncbi:MAG: response regulator transcription factor [Ignavibacteriales bacterium]|nr:MAG: response regulator transcription factor [Ignavibacteriales bacterium]